MPCLDGHGAMHGGAPARPTSHQRGKGGGCACRRREGGVPAGERARGVEAGRWARGVEQAGGCGAWRQVAGSPEKMTTGSCQAGSSAILRRTKKRRCLPRRAMKAVPAGWGGRVDVWLAVVGCSALMRGAGSGVLLSPNVAGRHQRGVPCPWAVERLLCACGGGAVAGGHLG